MKKITLKISILFVMALFAMAINGCAVTQTVADKNGSQLWGENCGRCHNAPMSNQYSAAQWEPIGMHMQNRANLSSKEVEKIIAFLQSGQ
jgi:cytochrome c553